MHPWGPCVPVSSHLTTVGWPANAVGWPTAGGSWLRTAVIRHRSMPSEGATTSCCVLKCGAGDRTEHVSANTRMRWHEHIWCSFGLKVPK